MKVWKKMSKRAYNFNAGPAALPFEVLQKAQQEFLEYQGIGMSIMEVSHRSAEFEKLNEETRNLVVELLQIPSGYKILFLQGGASSQFGMIPMNFLTEGKAASYVLTGSWGAKAIKEAKLFGETLTFPKFDPYSIPEQSAYLHITSNETIEGTQFQDYPVTGTVPLIADMSSDIMCRPIDVSKFAMIYAGAQKNLGPSGVTLVIIREDLIENLPKHIPTMFRYDTHAESNSLYNTPPVYSIYMMNLVLKWIKENGGLVAMEKRNREKAGLIYNTIDESEGFYYSPVDPGSRSIMNITFRLKDQELEKQFIKETADLGFVGLKGHRSVGGLRASAYNAVPYETCQALQQFMIRFHNQYKSS